MSTTRRRRPWRPGTCTARSVPSGPASRPIAEHAGAAAAARTVAIHQPAARPGAWSAPRAPSMQSQVISTPSNAQAKLLAEYHQTASEWTAETQNTAVAHKAVVTELDSRRTSSPRAGMQSRNGMIDAAVNATAAFDKRRPASCQVIHDTSSNTGATGTVNGRSNKADSGFV